MGFAIYIRVDASFKALGNRLFGRFYFASIQSPKQVNELSCSVEKWGFLRLWRIIQKFKLFNIAHLSFA
jgi:hypothetical protein